MVAAAEREEKKPTFEEASNEIEQRIIKAAMYFEELEDMGLIGGNGFHVAQRMGQSAKDILKRRWTGPKE